jgi:hypothetical protein
VADACDIRDHGVPDEDHNDIPDECEPVTAGLDIRPGGCPNPLNLRSRGVLTAAIVGGPGLDVADIDVSSLFLERSDGIGGSVRPLAGLPGPGTTIEDAATPLSGTTCECHELAGDGIDDLLLKFSTQELVESLELSPLAAGTSVPLKITGALHNGRPLEASDCIVITGASKP